jgi:hypothetical protein
VRSAVRTVVATLACVACASGTNAGPLGEGAAPRVEIVAVDSALPPHNATVQLAQSSYVALVLVAPGHSATLLYPADSSTTNQFAAGNHQLGFRIPEMLVRSDSMLRLQPIPRSDTTRIGARRTGRGTVLPPLPPTTPTYLLAVSSPQELNYRRILDKTLGVSIPTIDTEALNAVGKAIKSTITNEPREWAGYYRLVELRQYR